MEDVELAYLAGLIDGEGTITLTSNKSTEKRTPVLSMTNTDKPLIYLLKEAFGGSIRSQKIYQDHHTPAWIWSCRYNRAYDAIKQLRPFLKHSEKIRRADLIINEYKSVTPRNGKYTPEMLAKKQSFEDRFFHPSTP